MTRGYSRILTLLSIVIVTFAVEAIISNSNSDEGIRRLKTSSGNLVVRETIGRDCGSEATIAETCTGLYLNEQVILAEHGLSIGSAFPSRKNPLLVSVSTWTGGNACCEEDYIFDFTSDPPLKIEGYAFNKEISGNSSEVVFKMHSGTDDLGDDLKVTYSYQLGSGRPVKTRSEPIYKTAPLTDQSYPSDLLANPALRGPILNLIGKDHFSKFRLAFGISDPLKNVEGNFFIADGCQPHDCPHHAIYILDIANKLAWASEIEDVTNDREKARIWGSFEPNDIVPLREIRSWLDKNKIPQWRVTFVPLPANLAQLYKRPRQTVAKIELPQLPPSNTAQDAPAKPILPQTPGSDHVAVSLEKEGGTFVVPVSINGALTLKFTVDSGAADVSIPADVVMTLLRTGTLSKEDFLGKQTYRLADGSTVPSATFRIRSLKVGDRVIENVTGSVASVSGSLLLGQSFLSRFKSWSIDNQRQVLLLD